MDKKELTKLVSYFIMGDGSYYYMRLRSRDVSTFCEGVRPYIKDSFSYKIRMLDPFNKGGDIV